MFEVQKMCIMPFPLINTPRKELRREKKRPTNFAGHDIVQRLSHDLKLNLIATRCFISEATKQRVSPVYAVNRVWSLK